MGEDTYWKAEIETMDRSDLDALVDERVRSTVRYAAEHSPFYRKWFAAHAIDPLSVTCHEDLLELPIVSGQTIRDNQPPLMDEFAFRSADWADVYTIHETSGTSGVPKSFFLTWDDWTRYAEKYARAFTMEGLTAGDRLVVCASYGMNVGANTMTLAAHDMGLSVIPEGKCTFPVRVITSYRPTAIVGSVFKLLRLARRLDAGGIAPRDSGVRRLVIGGESFAEEARAYLEEVWGCPVYNTYGSTEGTMCGECRVKTGLHCPEDLVHVDLYDPSLGRFVRDGEDGRLVLTTLIPPGGKTGTLLINYDTEDWSRVVDRGTCACGRTHMKIHPPWREAESVLLHGCSLNRMEIEGAVFQPEHMKSITGEYEAFIYGDENETTVRVSMECTDPSGIDRTSIKNSFLNALFSERSDLQEIYEDGQIAIIFNFTPPGGLELASIRGRPKRLVDRR
ncbi:coenzyme F390 synthetase [Methanofollis fontis]|uniref:Coenzyme F390 synthetase n=1 Tax=Methanofollis fontis TaxID=2052832 RepID=A0A483CUG6_9EURY|nr:coenzyme F390 synthetase [Methanofollis fontis]TAJ45246.1 coenzyme F390 synthetase [Methanofollis fontis]